MLLNEIIAFGWHLFTNSCTQNLLAQRTSGESVFGCPTENLLVPGNWTGGNFEPCIIYAPVTNAESRYHLDGQEVKALRVADPGNDSCLGCGFFSLSSHTSNLRFGHSSGSGMLIFRVFFVRYFWPDLKNTCMLIFSYFIFLFLNFLSLFVFIFCETAHTHRFSVIFTKAQWHPWWLHCQAPGDTGQAWDWLA